MNVAPIPVVFEPLFKVKPWGGRRLAELLSKTPPVGEPVGESWELVSLPENESRVHGGPLAGQTLDALVQTWAGDLLGQAQSADGRFPLLIKFLDACENLSVQVHPKPDPHASGWQTGVKHEAWYVLHAEPGAKLYVGLKPGVGPEDVARVANTPRMVDVLREWPGRPGQCFYLPSGTLHALGAGLLVAEVQTPSDITYRAYDWDRVGLDGKPRQLHLEQSLANIRYDVTADMVLQPSRDIQGPLGLTTRVAGCQAFTMDIASLAAGRKQTVPAGKMRIWMILGGRGQLRCADQELAFATGDTLLIPAAARSEVEASVDSRLIEALVPRRDA
jgi:mannose-6-phosphate isomerase